MPTWSFPAQLEEALWAAARALLPEGALDPRSLATAIAERTKRYTTERERLSAPLGAREPRDLAARALFFTVADAAKIAIPVAELTQRGLLPAREPLRVLDVGAGAGAMMLGLAAALPGRRLEVTAVDRDQPALALLARAAAAIPSLAVRTHVSDVASLATTGPYELIVAGTLINELPVAARVPLVTRLVGQLAADGALILIEPALRETSRALHELRDALLTGGVAHVFAPCTRAGAPCPALADARDWCHEDRPFQPPPRLTQLIRATGLRREGLKFSYLTLRRTAETQVVVPAGRRALRVVSDALDVKGTIERILCGDEGRARRRILRREKGDDRRALADSRRGDVLLAGEDGSLREPD